MKKYTKEQIKSVRGDFNSRGYAELEVDLGNGIKFTYFVLPQGLQPKLRYFLFRSTGDKNDGYVFGVADSVPENFRPYAVAHEFIEFTEIGIDVRGRCAKALERELNLIPSSIKSDYIKMRRDFFRDIVNYSFGSENPNMDDIGEFRESLAILEECMVNG